jgi:hypothetical protein
MEKQDTKRRMDTRQGYTAKRRKNTTQRERGGTPRRAEATHVNQGQDNTREGNSPKTMGRAEKHTGKRWKSRATDIGLDTGIQWQEEGHTIPKPTDDAYQPRVRPTPTDADAGD